MICPLCRRPTPRMVYKSGGRKLCPNCNDPNYISLFVFDPELVKADADRFTEFVLFGPPSHVSNRRLTL